jgi:hypothetical protein
MHLKISLGIANKELVNNEYIPVIPNLNEFPHYATRSFQN